jgi:hypothetical protein
LNVCLCVFHLCHQGNPGRQSTHKKLEKQICQLKSLKNKKSRATLVGSPPTPNHVPTDEIDGFPLSRTESVQLTRTKLSRSPPPLLEEQERYLSSEADTAAQSSMQCAVMARCVSPLLFLEEKKKESFLSSEADTAAQSSMQCAVMGRCVCVCVCVCVSVCVCVCVCLCVCDDADTEGGQCRRKPNLSTPNPKL